MVTWQEILAKAVVVAREEPRFCEATKMVIEGIPFDRRAQATFQAAARFVLTKSHHLVRHLLLWQGKEVEAEMPSLLKLAIAHHTDRCLECRELAVAAKLSLTAPHSDAPPFPPLHLGAAGSPRKIILVFLGDLFPAVD